VVIKQIGKGSYGAALLARLKIDRCAACLLLPVSCGGAGCAAGAPHAALHCAPTLTGRARAARSSVLLVIKRVRLESAKERVSAQQEARATAALRWARQPHAPKP
jgi:hypothetical protein